MGLMNGSTLSTPITLQRMFSASNAATSGKQLSGRASKKPAALAMLLRTKNASSNKEHTGVRGKQDRELVTSS